MSGGSTFRAPEFGAYWRLSLIVAVAFAVWAAVIGRPDFPLDDAYITLHNARVLLHGYDQSYGVSALTGATSPVHLLIVAALGVVFDLQWAGGIAGWLAVWAYLAGLLTLAQRCGLLPRDAALLVICGALIGVSPFHFLNGLETGLAMAVVIWAIALAIGPPTWPLPVLLGLLPFIRPELALLSAVLFAVRAHSHWRCGLSREMLTDAAIMIAVAAPWLAWLWFATGGPMPQTAAAKSAFFAEAAWPMPRKLAVSVAAVGTLLAHVGPLALGLGGLWLTKVGRAALAFTVVTTALLALQFPGGLGQNQNRYLYVHVPLLLAGLAFLVAGSPRAARRYSIILLMGAVGYAAVLSPFHLRPYYTRIEFTRTERAGVAAWIEANTPRDSIIAVHDAGHVAFTTDRRLVDVVGLKTPASRRAHQLDTAPSAGARRGAALVQILADSHAGYLVVSDGWWRHRIVAPAQAAGAKFELLRGDGTFLVYRVLPDSSLMVDPGRS